MMIMIKIQNPILLKAQGMGFKAPPKAKESLFIIRVAGRLAYFINIWKVLTGDFCHSRLSDIQSNFLNRASSSIKGRNQVLVAEGTEKGPRSLPLNCGTVETLFDSELKTLIKNLQAMHINCLELWQQG